MDELVVEATPQGLELIPKCVLNCVYQLILERGCSHLDSLCFCENISPVLYDSGVQSCLEDCQYLGQKAWAKGSITEYCATHSLLIKFPPYMLDYKDLFNRGASGSGSGSPLLTTTTLTSTMPWGSPAKTYEYFPPSGVGTATVVIAESDTIVLRTFSTTTTVSSGQTAFTSTFTDPQSAAITNVVGVTRSSLSVTTITTPPSSSPPSSSTSQGISPPTGEPTSNGLSTGVKIGIAVPIVVIILLALGVSWYFRRRRKHASTSTVEQEKKEGGLRDHTSTVQELGESEYGPKGGAQEVDGAPIHEMHASQGRAGLVELHENPSSTPLELTASPIQQHRSVSPKSLSRKPVAPMEATSSSSEAPWENTAVEEFQPPQRVVDEMVGQGTEADDAELARLQAEVAGVKQKRERLQKLEALEAREEELERTIRERTKGGGSKP